MHSTPPLNPSWVIIFAGVCVAAHIGKLAPAITVLQHELDISLVQSGFLLSAVQIAGMALGLLVGLSADHWGLRRSMLCGLLIVSVASLLGATTTHFTWLLGTRILEGMGLLLVVLPAPGLIRRHVTPSALTQRLGWWSAYMPLGTAIALVLGPWVLEAFHWQWWWSLLGAASGVAAWAVWRHVPADPAQAAPTPLRPHTQWRPRLMATLSHPGPWLVALCFMVYTSQWIGIIGFLPTIYAEAGIASTLAGSLTALVAVINVTGNVLAGRLLQRGWTPLHCLQIGFVLMGLCATLAFLHIQGEPLAPLWMRFASILVFSAAGGLIPGALFYSALHLAPSHDTTSTTIGFIQQWSCVGQFIGPPIVAVVAISMGGWHWTWLMTSCMCILGCLLALGIQKYWRLSRQRASGTSVA